MKEFTRGIGRHTIERMISAFLDIGWTKKVFSSELDCIHLAEFSQQLANLAWLLLTATYGKFILHPALSLTYVLLRAASGEYRVGRYRGLVELECLRLPQRIQVRPGDLKILTTNISLLDTIVGGPYAKYLGGISAAFTHQLSIVPPPETWAEFVGHLEFILNPMADRPLGKVFAERFALTQARTDLESKEYFELGRILYDYRSAVLHGRKSRGEAALSELLGPCGYPFPSATIARLLEFFGVLSKQVLFSSNPEFCKIFARGEAI